MFDHNLEITTRCVRHCGCVLLRVDIRHYDTTHATSSVLTPLVISTAYYIFFGHKAMAYCISLSCCIVMFSLRTLGGLIYHYHSGTIFPGTDLYLGPIATLSDLELRAGPPRLPSECTRLCSNPGEYTTYLSRPHCASCGLCLSVSLP